MLLKFLFNSARWIDSSAVTFCLDSLELSNITVSLHKRLRLHASIPLFALSESHIIGR